MEITTEDINLLRRFKKSPLVFIEKMWGLTPQPVKLEYETLIRSIPLQEWKPQYFQPFIKGEHITWQQTQFFLSIEKALRGESPKRISVVSGHGTGKTGAFSMLIIWFLFCFKDSQIPCTAPTSEQMYDVLWKEISIWINKMPKMYKDLYEWQSGHIRIKDSPETWFARAATARKENPEALAGVHGENVMFAIDEASGVPDVIFSTGEGALTNADILFIMISNGTRLTGYFYESHNADRKNWQCLRFNSEESPLVDWEFVNRIEEKYGPDSDEYRVKVLGLFPKSDAVDEEGYVPMFNREMIHFIESDEVKFAGQLKMGLDPAGSGRDKAQWYARDSFMSKRLLTEDISSPKSLSEKTLTLQMHYGIAAFLVWVDNFGVGANAIQEMAFAGQKVNGVNFGDTATDTKRFINKRAEMYWRLREWFVAGGKIEKDSDLVNQLLSIRYRSSMNGRIEVMPKIKMKKLGHPSPDKADAIALTFYEKDNTGESATVYPQQVKKGWKYSVLKKKTVDNKNGVVKMI